MKRVVLVRFFWLTALAVWLGPSAAWAGGGVCGLPLPNDPDTDPPAYYAIDLVPTRNLPGLGRSEGTAHVSFAPSPFGIALSPDGRYVYDLALATERLPTPKAGVYVVWVATPSLDQIRRLGVLDAGRLKGRVDWNKFLVVVTLEPSADALGAIWQGPIIMRGLSRSGLMHTMAGHGPFQQEPCAQYGYY